MNVLDRADNPYREGSTLREKWDRAKREGFSITEEQLEFCLGSREAGPLPERIG